MFFYYYLELKSLLIGFEKNFVPNNCTVQVSDNVVHETRLYRIWVNYMRHLEQMPKGIKEIILLFKNYFPIMKIDIRNSKQINKNHWQAFIFIYEYYRMLMHHYDQHIIKAFSECLIHHYLVYVNSSQK